MKEMQNTVKTADTVKLLKNFNKIKNTQEKLLIAESTVIYRHLMFNRIAKKEEVKPAEITQSRVRMSNLK